MELAGHTCIGFCEWDKYATMSYTSMHLLTDEQRNYLSTLSLKDRQKEILKEEYRNGEWYSNDIRHVRGSDVPRADCWIFGAPCQDFSNVGNRRGLEGDRSSLIKCIFGMLREIRECDRPEWLIYENVVGMLSCNRGFDFFAILLEFWEIGYDIEWSIFNTKDFGIPQNRERVYTIGHLRSRGEKRILFDKETVEYFDTQNRRICKDNKTVVSSTLLANYPYNINGTFIDDEKGIRPFTPLECFRLQGWSDEYFDRAKFVNTNRQLYKQAGNGISVPVVEFLGNRMKEVSK